MNFHFSFPTDNTNTRQRLYQGSVYLAPASPASHKLVRTTLAIMGEVLGTDDVRPGVTDVDANTEPPKPARHLPLFQVRSRNVELEGAEDLGEPAHADTADTDEVHVANATAKHQTAGSSQVRRFFYGSLRLFTVLKPIWLVERPASCGWRAGARVRRQ